MGKKPINEVLAENLAHFMKELGLTQAALGKRAGVAQTTVGYYLTPHRRQSSKSGKEPSAKLSEVEQLADGLGIEVWELLRPLSPEQRKAYQQIESAYKALHPAEDAVEDARKRTG